MSTKSEKVIPKRPNLFSELRTRNAEPITFDEVTLKKLRDTNFFEEESFRYEPMGSGIKSTQELSVNYDKFENHVFFDSAQAKINIAFDKIINDFPFDGTRKQQESFFDNMTGYENHIFGNFPKHVGFLNFSGAIGLTPAGLAPKTDGNYIEVKDSKGSQFPTFSTVRDGNIAIEFQNNPFTFDYHLYVSPKANDCQIIFQKMLNSEKSVSIALSASSSPTTCDLIFGISSGSQKIFVSSSIPKGEFSHLTNIYDRGADNKAKIYLNGTQVATSSNSAEFNLSFNQASLYIASGSTFSVDASKMPDGEPNFIPKETFSGSMDELRIFHKILSPVFLKENAKKTIYASKDLKLYFKFNEASGTYKPSDAVLDSSGNSLHSLITNYKNVNRLTGSIENPMTQERSSLSPILFPDHYLVKNFNTRLLTSASRYDLVNPNIITKLVPPHMFLDGQQAQGFNHLQGKIFDPISGKSIPGSARLGSAQLLTSFLLIYGKAFDELKMVIDSISNFLHLDYDDFETAPDKLLPHVAKYYGIDLPSLFSNATIFEFIEGEDIGDVYGFAPKSLRQLQSDLWKRFLINLPYIKRTKGTVNSVKSTLRSFGINPDNLMTVREFGGPTKKSLSSLRKRKIKNLPLLDFSGSVKLSPGTEDYNGYFSEMPHIISPALTGSRVEPGYPPIQGDFVSKSPSMRNGISDNREDGLLTSGSFSYEAFYRYPENRQVNFRHPVTQSLARLLVTGSSIAKGAVVANLIALSGTSPTLSLYVRSSLVSGSEGMKLSLSGAQIFNGDPWYISFGRIRSDDVVTSVSESHLANPVSFVGSSSYFIRCSNAANGKIFKSYQSSKLFKDVGLTSAFENASLAHNVSGSIIALGSSSLGTYTGLFLSDTKLDFVKGFESDDRLKATATRFTGQIGKIRFWSGALTKEQSSEHTLDPSSIGSENPNIHYSYEAHNTGSWFRPRIDLQLEQPGISGSISGGINLVNYTQELGPVTGSGFEANKLLIKNRQVFYSQLSPKFDLAQSDEKIRVRSYKSAALIDESTYASSAPVYEVRKSESPDDDNRFSIEFSAVKALDDDIMTLFSSLMFFDNALGDPNLLFDEIYPDIEQARKVYFRRLYAKPEFKNYYEMFRWFNSSFGYIVEQLVPRNTKFLGIDFVYESHPLERSKFRYLFDDIYLFSKERSFDRGDILLSQYVGTIKKF